MPRNPLLKLCLIAAALHATVLYADTPGTATTTTAAKTAPNPAATMLVNDPVGTQGIVQLVLGLAVVLALIFLLAWLARRMGGIRGYAGGSLRVLGGLSMGARERVVLMQVGDTQLLLGVAPGRIQTLHVLEKPVVPPADDTAAPLPVFAERLKSALQRSRP